METTNLVYRLLGRGILAFAVVILVGRTYQSSAYEDIWAKSHLRIANMMDPTFSTIPINWCESDELVLPSTSDEGESGVWSPSRIIDVSGQGGTTITVTFTPTNTAFNPISFNITIDVPPYLGINQIEPLKFCKLGGDIIVDLVDTLDLQLDQIMTLQGDGQLFSFISENSFNPSNFEAELRTLNIKDIPSGPYSFFVESAAVNECLFTTQSFSLEVLDLVGGTDNRLDLCFGNQRFHDFDALINSNGEGIWEEKAGSNSGLNLNSASSMDLSLLPIGNYMFDYILFGTGPCIGRTDTTTLVINIVDDSEITLTQPNLTICGKDNVAKLNVLLNGKAPFEFVVQLIDDQGNLYPAYSSSTANDEFFFDVQHTTGVTRIENDIIYLNQSSSFYTLTPIALQDGVSDYCFNSVLNGSTRIDFQFAEVEINETLCPSEDYQILGETFNASRPFGTVLKQGDCDTTYIVNLSFDDIPIINVHEEICENESITLFGETFSANNLTSSILVNSLNGCDTVYDVTVSLKNRRTTPLFFEICPGETIDIGGTEFDLINSTGTVIFSGSNGCDSVVNVSVTPSPQIYSEVNNYDCTGDLLQVLCAGDTVVVENELFHIDRPSGIVHLISFDGCDSIVNVSLTYFLPVTEDITGNMCESDVRIIGGVEFNIGNPSGSVTLTGSNGCDSTINVDFTYQVVDETNLSETICQGESFNFGNGVILSESETATTLNLITSLGCDSVVNYSVVVNSTYEEQYIESICEDESRTIGSETFDASRPSGIVTFTTVQGCDSVINVNLDIQFHKQTFIQETYCNGETVGVGGTTFSAANPNGEVVLVAANGCDSTVTVDLTFGQASITDFQEIICQGEAFDFGNGVVLDENSTAQTLNLVTPEGCDSVVNYSVVVNPTYVQDYNATICEDESVTFGSIVFDKDNSSGVAQFSTVNGCDSIITVNLQVNFHSETLVQESLCDSDVRIIGSTEFNIDSPDGIVVLSAANGCDSTVTVDLTYGRSSNQNFTETICDDESYDFGDGIVLNVSTTSMTRTLTTPEGCDSIINYSVVVNPTYVQDYNATICEDESVTFGSIVFDKDNSSGVAQFSTVNGCDSIITVNLQVNFHSETLVQESLCDSDVRIIGSTEFNIDSPDGIVVLSAANGCDSTVTVDLTYGRSSNQNFTETICDDESYDFGDGIVLNVSNTSMTRTLTTPEGCDSILNYSVVVNPSYTEMYNEILCEGESRTFGGQTFDINNPSGLVQLTTVNGCDSVVNVNLQVNELLKFRY